MFVTRKRLREAEERIKELERERTLLLLELETSMAALTDQVQLLYSRLTAASSLRPEPGPPVQTPEGTRRVPSAPPRLPIPGFRPRLRPPGGLMPKAKAD